jgi:mannose-1-phosphate guanylyltransferase/mannose-6-phosphate isomerase
VERFVEKPDEATAEQYIRGGYFWNSGMFLFETGLFFEELKAHAPEVAEIFDAVYRDKTLTIAEAFAMVPKVSVDYGIMEKTSRAAVVPLGVAWNDLGSFDALYSVLEKDEVGNTLAVGHRGLGSSGNLVLSESGATRLIATIGCTDMAIVDTRDALLICPRSESQQVGAIVSALRDAGDERALLHLKVHRPWGSYLELEKHPGYKIKRITVLPGRRLSLQMHHHRSEHWVVVSGTGRVLVGEKEFLLQKGESTFVPAGEMHRLENVGKLPLEIIEVQLGEYVGEDDIVRFEDDFKRV